MLLIPCSILSLVFIPLSHRSFPPRSYTSRMNRSEAVKQRNKSTPFATRFQISPFSPRYDLWPRFCFCRDPLRPAPSLLRVSRSLWRNYESRMWPLGYCGSVEGLDSATSSLVMLFLPYFCIYVLFICVFFLFIQLCYFRLSINFFNLLIYLLSYSIYLFIYLFTYLFSIYLFAHSSVYWYFFYSSFLYRLSYWLIHHFGCSAHWQ